MKALQVQDNLVSVEQVDLPIIEGECLVRVNMSGICNTDLEIIKGYAGFEGTIGHEFVGVVEKAPDHPDLLGKRVVGEINVGCGDCEKCSAGDARHCERRTVLGIKGRDGAHAEYLSLPARNLILIPDNVSDRSAVFVEPLAAAIGITEQVEIDETTRVGVIGDGKLGILCAVSLKQRSGRVTLIGKHASKLKIASDQGVSTTLISDIADSKRSFDLVVEASGSESGFELALELVRPRGKIVLKSTFSGKPSWEAWRVVVDEITIVGSRCGKFAPAIELLSSGRIDVERMITAEFPLANASEALEKAKEKGVMKVLLVND